MPWWRAIWFGPETEGPPEHAHGGSIAAVLDEVLGLAAWAAGHAIVVGKLNVHFQKLLPLRTVVQVDSRIVSVEGRKVLVRGRHSRSRRGGLCRGRLPVHHPSRALTAGPRSA